MKQLILCVIASLSLTLSAQPRLFVHDYSQTWTVKMFLSEPDGKGGSRVYLTFEQALDLIKKADNLSLGVPKIVYLVGWQYNGHDDKYPAFFEANPRLKRANDATANESLRWLIREARKYHTTVSLHINMMDVYSDSPLFQEYVDNDLISKGEDGKFKTAWLREDGVQAYLCNYPNEWNKGFAQKRIDRLLATFPEVQEGGTIHIDAWFARNSKGFNQSAMIAADYQRKICQYWRAKGMDVTTEFYLDYMEGLIPLAWHFVALHSSSMRQEDYLRMSADFYTGVDVNENDAESRILGWLFGRSVTGEGTWKEHPNDWQPIIMKDFMSHCPRYFYLNTLKRKAVEGEGNSRVAVYSDEVRVSLKDSTIMQASRTIQNKNTFAIPAVWRNDHGIILYTDRPADKQRFDAPYLWGDVKSANLFRITYDGLKSVKKIAVKANKIEVEMERNVPYYLIPE